ncbi:MAG: DUF177 domain-containing protein [Candidatus Marinimicrobia bacterium]|nr:DUF177 domain-containing protein [Candidatus Neomarinimicrobiota bacterium]
MKLSLNTLPRGKSEQIFDSIAQLQHDDTIEWKPLKLELKLSIDRQDQNFYLQGKVACTGIFICEFGMEDFEDTLEGNFELFLTYNPKHLDENESEDIILLTANQIEFDLYPYVHDTVLLAIPISHICGPDCDAGKALKKSMEAEAESDDRWAKLKDLFNE